MLGERQCRPEVPPKDWWTTALAFERIFVWRAMERQPSHVRFSRMNSDRVIECAIRTAKNLLWQNLPPTHTLPDGATVARVRELVNSPSIQSALQCGSDTFLAFVLREVQFVIADRSLTDRQILARLWDVLDARHLNQALGITQRSRMILGPYPKRPSSAGG
jgi:hypothetical protein